MVFLIILRIIFFPLRLVLSLLSWFVIITGGLFVYLLGLLSLLLGAMSLYFIVSFLKGVPHSLGNVIFLVILTGVMGWISTGVAMIPIVLGSISEFLKFKKA